MESTKGYIENARAENTLRAYRSDMRHFIEWAEGHGLQAMPAAPQTVSLYLSDLARQGYKPSTLQRRLTAISQAHKRSNFQFDTGHALIRETLGGIKRTCGTEQDQKEALLTEDIRAMVKALPDTTIGLRDRAILLLGFAGAFRRSELVSLDVEDLRLEIQGMVVHLGRSKTDQEGEGRDIPHTLRPSGRNLPPSTPSRNGSLPQGSPPGRSFGPWIVMGMFQREGLVIGL